jgi:hypothetical protein
MTSNDLKLLTSGHYIIMKKKKTFEKLSETITQQNAYYNSMTKGLCT